VSSHVLGLTSLAPAQHCTTRAAPPRMRLLRPLAKHLTIHSDHCDPGCACRNQSKHRVARPIALSLSLVLNRRSCQCVSVRSIRL